MISRDLLYAILLGLPDKFLEFLAAPWPFIATLIRLARERNAGPVAALQYAVHRLGVNGRGMLRKALQRVAPVMSLPGLTYRQREALLALRSLHTASLRQLCSVLLQDRSNIHRRMAALVRKGYAIKFMQPNGVFYMAVDEPLQKGERAAINKFLDELIRNFPSENESDLAPYATAAEPFMPWGNLTTPTTSTTLTTPTTSPPSL